MNPYETALYEAAIQTLDAGQAQAAIDLLKLAIGTADHTAFFLYALGNAQFKDGRFEDAVTALTASVHIDPLRAEAFNDLSAALFALGRETEALGSLRRALDLRPDLAEAEETDGIWLLRYGQYRDGWRKYEARFRTRANHMLRRSFSQPQWYGEPLAGRTILLHAEQGLGDTVQFVRYAPLVALRGGRVVLEIYPEVRPLLSRMPGISAMIDRGMALPSFDLHCSFLSVPLAFHTEMDSIPATIPYVSVPDGRPESWRRRLGPRRRMRIGVAWSGNPQHRDDRRRSIPFEMFSTLLVDRPDVEFHVVQTELRAADRTELQRLPHVHNHADALADFGDTAALLTLMDLVISVDTSAVHLAGALGCPVWLLLAHVADWRWLLERDDSPWYPTLELFRQPTRDDWTSVLSAVGERIDALLA